MVLVKSTKQRQGMQRHFFMTSSNRLSQNGLFWVILLYFLNSSVDLTQYSHTINISITRSTCSIHKFLQSSSTSIMQYSKGWTPGLSYFSFFLSICTYFFKSYHTVIYRFWEAVMKCEYERCTYNCMESDTIRRTLDLNISSSFGFRKYFPFSLWSSACKCKSNKWPVVDCLPV